MAFSPSASLLLVPSPGHTEGEVKGSFQEEPEPHHRAASQEKQLFPIALKVKSGNVLESAEAASSTLLRGQPRDPGIHTFPLLDCVHILVDTVTPG